MDQKISKCLKVEVEHLMNQLASLADTLRELGDNYRSLQNSYMTTALQISQLKAFVDYKLMSSIDYMAADAKKEAGDGE